MASSVRLEGISKSYTRDVPVLLPMDLSIEKGEIFFLLGPSGCGKSTLLRIVAGLVTPDSGKIFFDGEDVSELPPEKRRAVMVFQNYALWPHMTVFENVAFGPRTAGMDSAGIRKRVEDSLALVRMSDYADRKPPFLSGGQQQRVALARAIAAEPRLLLLDEPLSNLDAKLRDEMRTEIRRICRERSLTALYVTHDRREALGIGDRIALLNRGRISQAGTPAELYRHPENRFAASFLGSTNFLRGRVVKAENGFAELETSSGKICASVRKGMTLSPGEEKTILIRPEHLSASEENGPNRIRAKFESGTFLGPVSEMTFRLPDGTQLEVSEDPSIPMQEGKEYTLAAKAENTVILED